MRAQLGDSVWAFRPEPARQDRRSRPGSSHAVNPKGINVISKKAIALCATVGVAISGIALATPAIADPVSNSYSIVGSDTLEDAVGALANGTTITGSTVRSSVNLATIGSFDATGSPYLVAKSGGVRFGRPNGSGDGVTALSRSISGAQYTSGTVGGPANVVISNQVDIARSSSEAKVPDTNGALLYIPFGRDAISYAYNDVAGTATGIAALSATQLKSLFECTVRTINGVTITPVIPQANSGTRKSFLSMISSDENSLKTVDKVGGCVIVGQEHDATTLTAESVMPMAVSRWVAMNTTASYDKRGTATLGDPIGTIPVTGTGAGMTANAAYYANATWGRDTYLVAENARLDSTNAKYDANLAKLLDSTQATALTNSQTTTLGKAGSVKKKFGFLPPTAGLVAYRAAVQ